MQPGWLLLESGDTPMHIGALMLFELPKSADRRHVHELGLAMRSHKAGVAPWNLRLSKGVFSRFNPRWQTAAEVDLDYHFRQSALPRPGGERELGVLVSRLHSHAMDMTRPLWECHLIEGVHGHRFAFYVKLHHALVGGRNGMQMLMQVLSASARKRNMPPMWALPFEPETQDRSAEAPAGGVLEPTLELGRALGRLLRAGLGSSQPLQAPYTAPRSALNARVTPQRRFATQQYDLGRVKGLARKAEVSVDTLLCYLCGTALRRFFKEYNALPEKSLVAAVPVNAELVADAQGEGDGIIYVTLGTQYADPLRRLEVINASTEAARGQLGSLPPGLVGPYVTLVTLPYLFGQLTGTSALLPPMFNVALASLRGPQKPQYYNGARLQALYPIPVLLQGGALNITCLSYAGRLHFGLLGARDALPHLQRIAVYMGLALDDLEALLNRDGGEAV